MGTENSGSVRCQEGLPGRAAIHKEGTSKADSALYWSVSFYFFYFPFFPSLVQKKQVGYVTSLSSVTIQPYLASKGIYFSCVEVDPQMGLGKWALCKGVSGLLALSLLYLPDTRKPSSDQQQDARREGEREGEKETETEAWEPIPLPLPSEPPCSAHTTEAARPLMGTPCCALFREFLNSLSFY
jgi:hypothetical protein